MKDRIRTLQAIALTIPREVPYLGPIDGSSSVGKTGYFIRPGNGCVYSRSDHSVLVRVEAASGLVGWGECVTVVAPDVVARILEDLVFPLVADQDPDCVVAIYDRLYDAMRVRGFFGGFYHDALAAMDIALWDLKARRVGQPLAQLLGGARRTRIPAYVSGLPAVTLGERVALARSFAERGFNALKFAAAVASEGEEAELAALRAELGAGFRILADLHWRYSAAEAIRLITRMERHDLYLAEAPVPPEDMAGQAQVVASVRTPVAIGEELRTAYEYLPRFERRCMGVIQPEMGRTGITSFQRIAALAHAANIPVMPHASIGIGIFQAASLHVTATIADVPYHEYQHSIFDKNLRYVSGNMRCEAGEFFLPEGPGLGVEPTQQALSFGCAHAVAV